MIGANGDMSHRILTVKNDFVNGALNEKQKQKVFIIGANGNMSIRILATKNDFVTDVMSET